MTKIKKISAIMVAAVILCTCFLMSGCGGDTESSSSEKTTSAASNEETTSASTDTTDYKSSYTAIIDVKDYGKIEVELYEELAPITVKNFVDLAKDGFYDGLTFHRIITGFMIQGGDPLGNGTGGSKKQSRANLLRTVLKTTFHIQEALSQWLVQMNPTVQAHSSLLFRLTAHILTVSTPHSAR